VADTQDLTTRLRLQREKIDAIDAQLVCLLNQRAECAKAIGDIKGSGTIYRPAREAQVLRQVQQINKGPLPNENIAQLFREIMSICLAMERPLTVAYVGTSSEAAAIKHFGHAAKTWPCPFIDEACRMVEVGTADYVVVSVENLMQGKLKRTLEVMINTSLHVCGEVILRVHQTLLRKIKGLADLRCIYAQAQSLVQCQGWLDKNLPAVPRISVASEIEAARLASKDPTAAAIANQGAMKPFTLSLLAKNIEDKPKTMRFCILGRESVEPSGYDKTSLILSAKNKLNAMQALSVLVARHGVNMTCYDAQPAHTGSGEQLFFVDLDGHQQAPHIHAALTALKTETLVLKMLGSYPGAVL
jgi:chorismate mutase/prephenate dehydratase